MKIDFVSDVSCSWCAIALHSLEKEACFTEGGDPSDREVLAQAAEAAGLDPARAREVLAGGTYAKEVWAQERFYRDQGGQPPEVFEQALRQIAAQAAA